MERSEVESEGETTKSGGRAGWRLAFVCARAHVHANKVAIEGVWKPHRNKMSLKNIQRSTGSP
jgi:hypothetical protein